MYARVLSQMKDAVRFRKYIVTIHAAEELDDDGFSVFDVEHSILHGDIVERQKEQASAEWKYLIRGVTFQGKGIYIVAKLSVTGKLVVITVYAT